MTQLKQLVEAGLLSPIDERLSESLTRRTTEHRTEIALAVALASRAVQAGHICAELGSQQDVVNALPDVELELPPVKQWVSALRTSPLVSPEPNPEHPTPLILDDSGRLYLYRYAQYQAALAHAIKQRVGSTSSAPDDHEQLSEILARLYPDDNSATPEIAGQEQPHVNLQRLATLAAISSRFTLISGGPGTGKTYTVTQVLALLVEQALVHQQDIPRIKLLAPTGKAAQRLGESIQNSVRHLNCSEDVKAHIPKEAITIHRALGFQPQTPTRFKHNAGNPLPADVVLVDEASMVDLALMAKLIDAVSQDARFILLGDKDQLASVEAGAILGDIYGPAQGYTARFAERAKELTGETLTTDAEATPLSDCMVHLTQSRRYQGKSGIGALARAVNAGNAEAAMQAFERYEDIQQLPLPNSAGSKKTALPTSLARKLERNFKGLTQAPPLEKLKQLTQFRVLCAHRRGAQGVEALNLQIQNHLSNKGLIDARTEWYVGRPILITQNDYQLGLYNGDVGVLDKNPKTGVIEAYFEGEDQTLRVCSAARLPAHETVFAMTVHKSQGSEFDGIALLLPEELSPVLTRELVYTGITRAKREVLVLTEPQVFKDAIARRIERASGLREALWGRPAP